MNVLITGGAGFIGSYLARLHLEQGHTVWVVDNLQTGCKNNIEGLPVRFDQADLLDWPKLQEAVLWSDRIYHMAANVGMKYVLKYPADTLYRNIEALELILKWMTSSQRLLVASSSSVYGNSLKPILNEEDELFLDSHKYIQSSYSISKLVNERSALFHAHQRGVHCTIARIFNTTGLRQTGVYGMVVPTFIGQAIKNEPITVYGDGLQTRSFCHAKDTAEALVRLLDAPSSNREIINVGNNEEISIIDLAQLILKKTKSHSEIKHLPYKEVWKDDFLEIQYHNPDLRKLFSLTQFKPRITLDTMLDEMIEGALS